MTTLRPAVRSVAALYIPFDRSAGTPYYHQIYQGLRGAILDGRLCRGQRLPSTRSLASELGISRLPVLTAYDQLFHEGYLVGRIGAGTYVAPSVRAGRNERQQDLSLRCDLGRPRPYRRMAAPVQIGHNRWSLSRRPACARSVSAKSLVPPGFATRAAVAGRADGLRRTPRASPSSRGCGRLFARGARRSLRALPGADGRRVPDGAAALCGGAAAGQRCCLRREPRLSRCVEGAGGDRRHDSRCPT